jgi:hypothetical protein
VATSSDGYSLTFVSTGHLINLCTPFNARIKKEGKEGFSSAYTDLMVMVTKRLSTFKEAKVKSYVHWPVDKWIYIQNNAKELDVPNHWIVMDLLDFILSDKSRQLEFRRYLTEKHPGTTVQKGVSWNTFVRMQGLTNCPKCGLLGTEKGLAYHIKKCEGRSQPMEMLQECEIH